MGQRGIAKHLRHAYDPVHRCADFVAHLGKEKRFRAVGCLGRGAGIDELALIFHGFGNVAGERYDITAFSPLIDNLDICAIPELYDDGCRGLLLRSQKHLGAPFLWRAAPDIYDSFIGEYAKDGGIADTRTDGINTVEHGQIRPIGHDHFIVFVEKGKAVVDGFDRMPQPALGQFDLFARGT